MIDEKTLPFKKISEQQEQKRKQFSQQTENERFVMFPSHIRDYYVKDLMQILSGNLCIILSSGRTLFLPFCV